MKRLIITLAAAASIAGPIAAGATAAQAQRWDRDRREDRWDRREDRRDGRRDNGRRDRREDRWDRREDRWDQGRHNGYYYRERWYWGPPPQAYYNDPYFRPGYSLWRRGVTLPGYYRGYVVNDYGRYRLRPPPRGYAWYRVGDDYLLAAIATGLILEAISR